MRPLVSLPRLDGARAVLMVTRLDAHTPHAFVRLRAAIRGKLRGADVRRIRWNGPLTVAVSVPAAGLAWSHDVAMGLRDRVSRIVAGGRR